MTEKTQPQLDAETKAANDEAIKLKAAEDKAQAAAEAKVKKDAEKAEKDKLKADAKVAKEIEKQANAQAKLDAKAETDKAKAEKALEKMAAKPAKVVMPEQNGVRRPKPEGLCGKVWTQADDLSRNLGSPVPIAALLESTKAAGLNEGNVRAEYARWRKFNGVTGRIVAQVAVITPPVPQAPAAPQAPANVA